MSRTPRNYNTYGLAVIEPPSVMPVSLALLRDQVEVGEDDGHDDKLKVYLQAATKWVQEQTETSLVNTKWRWTLDRFPKTRESLTLPRWPLGSLVSIKYLDQNSDQQTLDLATVTTRANDGRVRISRKDYAAWPPARLTPDAVEIEFIAGFGDREVDVPGAWQEPVLLLAANWFKYREAVTEGQTAEVPYGIQAMLDMLRDPDDMEDFDTE